MSKLSCIKALSFSKRPSKNLEDLIINRTDLKIKDLHEAFKSQHKDFYLANYFNKNSMLRTFMQNYDRKEQFGDMKISDIEAQLKDWEEVIIEKLDY